MLSPEYITRSAAAKAWLKEEDYEYSTLFGVNPPSFRHEQVGIALSSFRARIAVQLQGMKLFSNLYFVVAYAQGLKDRADAFINVLKRGGGRVDQPITKECLRQTDWEKYRQRLVGINIELNDVWIVVVAARGGKPLFLSCTF